MYLLLIVIVLLSYLYWKSLKTFQHWSSRGVPGPKPYFLIGNLNEIFKGNQGQVHLALSKLYGKVYGFFLASSPVLVINDNKLIKQVLVKDFSYFVNRRELRTYHEMWNKNIFNSEDEHWRRMRTIASPAFTSGKLRSMQPIMKGCVDKLINYIDHVVLRKQDGIVNDTKEMFAGFTIDVFATTTFATETDANGERSRKNPFVYHGQNFFNVRIINALPTLFIPKWLLPKLGYRTIFDQTSFQWLIDFTTEIVRQRTRSQNKRNDLVQLLLDASGSGEQEDNYQKLTVEDENDSNIENVSKIDNNNLNDRLTENEVISNCFLMFAAGFETTATTLFHSIYELAANVEVQQKLYDEIVQLMNDDDDGDDYPQFNEHNIELITNKAPYLEGVIKETLRHHPPVTIIHRRLKNVSYRLTDTITLPPNQLIEVNAYAVHHMEEYWPEPERFKPERFHPSNRDQIHPYTWLPFGSGPRNCLGMRFALNEIKLCLAMLIIRYRFEMTTKTPMKLKYKVASPLLNTESFPIKIVQRTA